MAWPITKEQVRAALRGATTATITDADLDDYAAVAMRSVERKIGPRRGQIAQQDVSLSSGLRSRLVLRFKAQEVTAVTVDGEPVTGWSFTGPYYLHGSFPAGVTVVTFTAPTGVEVDTELGTVRLAAFLVRQDRISNKVGNVEGEVPQGFAWPRAVLQLIEPEIELGGIA